MRNLLPIAVSAVAALACGKSEPAAPAAHDAANVTGDAAKADTPKDGTTAADSGAGPAVPAGHVQVSLADHAGPSTAKGAYARKISDAADLIGGPAAQGRKGDWIIGNAKARFIIQGADRHSGPCPWGGTVLDADVARPPGAAGEDNVGEYCLFFHLGRTQLATQFDIVADGSAGGAAVIAVTGPDTADDFINLPSMIASFLGGNLDLPLNVDDDLPLTITRYYVLRPDEQVLRVVTAFRNDGKAEVVTVAGELVDSGGSIQFFNPASTLKGFGYKMAAGEALDWLAFRGDASTHALAPPPVAGKPGGSYLAISGVAGCVFGTAEALALLLAGKDAIATHPAALKIAPGAVAVRDHLVAVGSGDLSQVSAAIWQARGAATGAISGKAIDPDGKGLAGLRVSAIKDGSTVTQFTTDAQGAFTGVLPPGAYAFSADAPGRLQSETGTAMVAPGAPATTELTFGPAAQLQVSVRTPSGAPVPAKVTVLCDGSCAKTPQSLHRDVTFDPLKAGWAAVEWVGVSGDVTLPLPAGTYKVVVTRGPTWSIFPPDLATSGGFAVEVQDGQTAKVDAVVGKAVDTSGWLSGDFHVHALASPDSPVTNLQRVGTFLAEGVDVLVATDHDVVTDFTPWIAEAKAEKWLASIIGDELTTFDYGHYIGFPLVRDANDLTGGAFDWGAGDGPGVTPHGIALALAGGDADRVVQINHPNGGFLQALKIDVKQGISLAPAAQFRLPPTTPDPVTGDTGLFSTAFTAMEIYNGHGVEKFYTCANWWFALLARGLRWTGTAVSDTHSWNASQSGGPRSWVEVGAGKDSVATLDVKHFAKTVNAMKVVGSNGPFVRARIMGDGKIRGLGEVIPLDKGGTAIVEVEIQAPSWMSLDSVELFVSPTDTAPPAGEQNAKAPKPTAVKKLALSPADLIDGVDPGTKRYKVKVTFEFKVEADGFAVVFVRGAKPIPEALVAGKTVLPFAYTNPLYWDTDGGGYDHPPLGMQPKVGKRQDAKGAGAQAAPADWRPAGPRRDLGPAEWQRLQREIEAHDH